MKKERMIQLLEIAGEFVDSNECDFDWVGVSPSEDININCELRKNVEFAKSYELKPRMVDKFLFLETKTIFKETTIRICITSNL